MAALLTAAGFRNVRRTALVGLALPAVLAGLLQEWLSVPGLSLAVFFGVLAFEYELLTIRAARRQRHILECWPVVIESLESAAVAGMSLVESLRDLAESQQLYVAKEFSECCRDLDSGATFDSALLRFKQKLGNAAADFTVELLRATNSLGSSGYVSALRNQTLALRSETALEAELAAKQGWVVGTAKLAVTAPWFIVLILCFRPENADMYSSLAGTTILLFGLIASTLALRMVYRIGNVIESRRVFP
ncbi:MAG: type II secretion system F family protein [Micrococcales bacterium]